MELTVNRFFNRIELLTQKGLASLFVINEKLMAREDYVNRLLGIAKDVANFSNIKGIITGKALLEAINNPIYIEHELKDVFTVKPTFARYNEANEIYRKLTRMKIPNEEWWTNMTDIL